MFMNINVKIRNKTKIGIKIKEVYLQNQHDATWQLSYLTKLGIKLKLRHSHLIKKIKYTNFLIIHEYEWKHKK